MPEQANGALSAHCLDTIRQVLMCNVDTGVLGQVWYDRGTVAAFPDFKTTHTCKNYDDVRKWAEKLQVSFAQFEPGIHQDWVELTRRQEVPLDQLPDDYMKAPDPKDVLSYTP